MYFEDYTVGREFTFGPVIMDEDEIVEFATRYDPQPFHVDRAAAADSVYGGLIASGWHTTAVMMRLLVDGFLDERSSMGSPGVDELHWSAPVRPGDELTVRVTVTDARVSASKPDRGIVRSSFEVRNQNDVVTLSMNAVNIIRRRPD